jgi:P-type Cu+ transporter
MGLPCVHCGEDCGNHPVLWDKKPFCCNGCSTVYQILNQNKLQKYYDIQPMSGIKVQQNDFGNKYSYIDNKEIKEKLLDFSDGGISKATLFIPSIHCASCIWLLENLYILHKGIISSTVNFPKKVVSVTFNDSIISLREVVELLVSIHYIPEITLDQLDKKDSGKSEKSLLLKIGISGFSFMNVMLYNFPEYLPGGDELSSQFTRFFGIMSFILALPVVIYCANDYYLSAYKGLRHKMINIDVPITLGVLTLFFQSSYEVISGNGIGYMDSLIGLILFLLIGKWYQGKTYQALSFERDYKSYFPVAVTKISNKIEETTPLSKLKVKDIILIRNQEIIPADSLLIKGEANIDYSFVTGESIPVSKKEGESIYAGGRQIGSSIEVEVIKNVEQSYLTQLWNQDNKDKNNIRLNTIINSVSEYFTIIILLIAFASAIYWIFNDPSQALFAFTSVLIIACPCALALTVPFTFGSTMRQFGQRGFYIKNTDVIEKLRNINTIIFDKTGTITINSTMKTQFIGNELNDEQLSIIKSLASNSSHPLSATVKDSIGTNDTFLVKDYQEYPSLGISGIVNDKRVNMGSCKFVTGKDDPSPSSTNVYVFIENSVLGYFKIENSYRSGLKTVINRLQKHYKLILLSGDNDAEKKNLKPLFGAESNLKFNQSPEDKMRFVEERKKHGEKVLMIGDGLNDAGALMESDIGLTIADDIYSFSPACDGIIESSKFSQLPDLINFSRTSILIVIISFIISFIYNFIGLYFAVQGNLSPIIAAILMPLSSVSVVAFATFSINYLAGRLITDSQGH